MPPFDKCSWSMSNKDEQLKRVRAATAEELRRMARTYDWSKNPEAVLGWMMAQKGMDLSSALVVFFNGDPGRFNYLSKKDVPQEFRGAARVLDNICLRMNSGFYRVRAGQKLPARAKLDADGSPGTGGDVLTATATPPLGDELIGRPSSMLERLSLVVGF